MLMQMLPLVFAVPSPDMVPRRLNDAVHKFSTSTDPAAKLQATMAMVEVKVDSAGTPIEMDGARKAELRQTVDKLDMTSYNRTSAALTDSAIKSALSRANIFKDRSLEFSSAGGSTSTSTTTSSSTVSGAPGTESTGGDLPLKSMALMDLKQRLGRIQMN
ncbi:hypothetical protein AaE_007281 [Aphanomyces astaci]|uniref:Uncharacterized protein n=1 Tax=Aphanomyces astaci TaxID=112090 RepID=A0A6A5AEU3_APHAT|nr:hypothetical protein AaE_007281 [Aphanomyces astaci]